MKLRSPWLIKCVGLMGASILRAWMGTVRTRLDFRSSGVHPVAPSPQRYIYAFWHETMLVAAMFRARASLLISQHADGEIIAQVARHFRVEAVRGSSTRGGASAVLQMIEASRRTHLVVTPDGPRGPRRKVQKGAIYLAARTGLPLVGFGAGFSHAWRARSWDRFAVPLPFSTVCLVGCQPLHVPPEADGTAIELYRSEFEARLLQATHDAENWAAGLPRSGQNQESDRDCIRKTA